MKQIYHIIPVPQTHLYDVFQDDGWNLWSRVLVKPSMNVIRLMKGEHIPIKILYRLFAGELAEGKPLIKTKHGE